jgi:hypothetical protein
MGKCAKALTSGLREAKTKRQLQIRCHLLETALAAISAGGITGTGFQLLPGTSKNQEQLRMADIIVLAAPASSRSLETISR